MIVTDWREADAAVLKSCYDQEARHWERQLGWQTTQTWSTIEEARVTWGLPGLLALDGPRVGGWAFYTRDADILQLGGLVSDSGEATARLLDEVLADASASQLPAVSCFVLDRAPDLRRELTTRGFEIENFLYLSAPLPFSGTNPLRATNPLRSTNSLRGTNPRGTNPLGFVHTASWRDADLDAAAALLRATYAGPAARHFAPHGEAHEWRHYLAMMVEQTACGVFDPRVTRVLRDGDQLRALAFVTNIGPRTAHLAQLAVRPGEQGHGLASQLLNDASELAASAGREEMTLLVGESNHAARRLYTRLGFSLRATFIAAHK